MRELLAVMLCQTILAGSPRPEWKTVDARPTLEFPRDHGAHLDYRTEWWYLTGTGETPDGARFAWQFTVFRQGLISAPAAADESRLRPRQVFVGHLAVHSIQDGRVLHAERLRRAGAGLAEASATSLDLWVEDWSMQMNESGVLSIQAEDAEQGIALDLAFEPNKELVLHGDHGMSRKGERPGNASVYYSWTRLATRGTLSYAGMDLAITGESWFDHEWGTTQLGESVVGWDWFALRLADGTELMLYQLRRTDGSAIPQSSGTVVDSSGRARALALGDFRIEVLGHWTSPRTGARYPARWKITVPSIHLDVELVPTLADAELDTTRSTGVVYWEGSVHAGGSTRGTGFVELTGYAQPMSGWF